MFFVGIFLFLSLLMNKNFYSLRVYLLTQEYNETSCYPECDGNFSRPFENFQQVNSFIQENHLQNLSSKTIEILLIVKEKNEKAMKNNNFFLNDSIKNQFEKNSSFWINFFMKVKIAAYFCENCLNCSNPSIIINNEYFSFNVNQEFIIENVDIIFWIQIKDPLFFFNNVGNASRTNMLIINSLIKPKENDLDISSGRNNLFEFLNHSVQKVKIEIKQTIIKNIGFNKEESLQNYYSFAYFNLKIDESILMFIQKIQNSSFLSLSECKNKCFLHIKNSLIDINGYSFLRIGSNFYIKLNNLSIFYNNEDKISPIFIKLNKENLLMISNSSISSNKFIHVSPFILGLEKNSLIICNSTFNNTGSFNLISNNKLKFYQVNIVTNKFFLSLQNKNKAIFDKSEVSYIINQEINVNYSLFLMIGSQNLIVMKNNSLTINLEENIMGNLNWFLVESENNQNGLILSKLQILSNPDNAILFYLDSETNVLIQIIEVHKNSIPYYYNSNYTCKSPHFIDNNIRCSSCSDILENCHSCIIDEDFKPICLSHIVEDNKNIIIIISLSIPLATIFLIVLFCFYQRFKNQDSQEEINARDYHKLCSIDDIPYSQSFAINSFAHPHIDSPFMTIGFVTEKTMDIELRIESAPESEEDEKSFNKENN